MDRSPSAHVAASCWSRSNWCLLGLRAALRSDKQPLQCLLWVKLRPQQRTYLAPAGTSVSCQLQTCEISSRLCPINSLLSQFFQRTLNPKQRPNDEENTKVNDRPLDERYPRKSEREPPRQACRWRPRCDAHALAMEPSDEGRFVWGIGLEAATILVSAMNFRALD